MGNKTDEMKLEVLFNLYNELKQQIRDDVHMLYDKIIVSTCEIEVLYHDDVTSKVIITDTITGLSVEEILAFHTRPNYHHLSIKLVSSINNALLKENEKTVEHITELLDKTLAVRVEDAERKWYLNSKVTISLDVDYRAEYVSFIRSEQSDKGVIEDTFKRPFHLLDINTVIEIIQALTY